MQLLDLLTSCFSPKPSERPSIPVYRLHTPSPQQQQPPSEEAGERSVPRYNVVGLVQPVATRNEDLIAEDAMQSIPMTPVALDSAPKDTTLESIDRVLETVEGLDSATESLDSVEESASICSETDSSPEEVFLDPVAPDQTPDESFAIPHTDSPDLVPNPCDTSDACETVSLPEDLVAVEPEPISLTFEQAAAQAQSDPLTAHFNPLLFKRSAPFWPSPAPAPTNYETALPALRTLFIESSDISDKLVEVWIRAAERRVSSGINVTHLVDYFEEAIIQQFL